MVVGIVNTLALILFTCALCWRLDQIRRRGGGLQPLAMTISIAALTLAFVVSGEGVAAAIDSHSFTGATRVLFYGLLAVGVAALIVVFFFNSTATGRARRAGVEALPLIVALIGLQVTMLLTPVDLRTQQVSEWTVRNVGFALFFLIASGYLAYGFTECVRSIRKFLTMAEGYLRTSLTVLSAGLALLAIGALVQIAFVLGSMIGAFRAPALLGASTVLSIAGVVFFLVGISYPMAHSRWHSMRLRRRYRRADHELFPLWSLVTEAVPEVVLPRGSRPSATVRLHRRVVETRDALTQLSPYLPDRFDDADSAQRAEMLRAAARRYSDEGQVSGTVREILPDEGRGLEGDVAPLIRVSRQLVRAR
ncbi:MAB_1171c family putative transporter [Gordonia soli]|uniref:DUF6545 domain-containing protein n=1 Tax=Gordonia soli NBRC 108243 TaxID=1223545 RepID=M0QI99_9ACTN|nr:MAB_1171c family putative transporter [Gordonia soli]GAC67157.1 hypothetical protein GS4_06_00030 [Gordonia soli NBRC 108243]